MLKSILIIMLAAILSSGFFSCSNDQEADSLSSDNTILGLESDLANLQADDGFGMHRMGIMADVLDLTDAQKEQIKDIFLQRKAAFHDAFKNREDRSERPTREERKLKRKDRHQALLAAITPILTADQQAIVAEMKAAHDRGEVPQILIEKRVEKMADKLNLTSGQQSQLKALFTEAGQQMLALRKNDTDRHEKREEMHSFREAADVKIKSILTPEQNDIYESIKAEKKSYFRDHARKFGKKFGKHRIEKRLSHMTETLELNADQEAQVKSILEAALENVMQEFEGGNFGARDSRHSVMRQHFEEVDAQIQDILTESQLEKYEAHKKERREEHDGGFHGH